jgi:hypothetical protein
MPDLRHKAAQLVSFSFCEQANASGTTPWHIRRLSAAGRKPSGGADTPSLCGRTVSWDLEGEVTPHHLTHCCQRCAAVYANHD